MLKWMVSAMTEKGDKTATHTVNAIEEDKYEDAKTELNKEDQEIKMDETNPGDKPNRFSFLRSSRNANPKVEDERNLIKYEETGGPIETQGMEEKPTLKPETGMEPEKEPKVEGAEGTEEKEKKTGRFVYLRNLPSKVASFRPFQSQEGKDTDESIGTNTTPPIENETQTLTEVPLPCLKPSYIDAIDSKISTIIPSATGSIGLQAGWEPLIVECPNCRCIIKSDMIRKSGTYAWMVFFVCILLGFLFCCLPWLSSCCPFCNRSYKDVEHYCPKCHVCLGRYKRQQWFCC